MRGYFIDRKVRKDCKLPSVFFKFYVKKECTRDTKASIKCYIYAAQHPGELNDKHHIGINTCLKGEIDRTSVKPKAESCGIGGILTLLCMVDKDVHTGRGADNLEDVMAFGDDDWRKNWFKRVRNTCEKVLVLINSANPKGAAVAYFSAAIRAKFGLIILYKKEDDEYVISSTEDAKKLYLNPSSNYLTEDYGPKWYFCKAPAPNNIRKNDK